MTLCVVFDFDGVLVDSNARKRQAYFDIFAPYGPDAPPVIERVLDRDVESDRFEIIRAILSALPTAGHRDRPAPHDPAVTELAHRYNDICEHHAATCAEIPGASEALVRLSRSMPLYVLSATPEEPLRRIVERRGWTGYFQDVLGRPGSKAEHLRAVLTREGIAGGDLLMVGDGKRDVDAARHLGTRFIGVRSAFNDFDRTPLVLLDDLTALPDLIESSAAPAPLLPGD